jgi:hypothetical protein
MAILALFVVACGPEDSRSRNGGTGASSRPEAPPTGTRAPDLIVRPTQDIPYATSGPLPTLPPPPTPTRAGSPAGTPGATRTPATGGSPGVVPSPGFDVPTTVPGTFAVQTPVTGSPTARP